MGVEGVLGRRGEIVLRDLIREAIGLEEMLWEWGVLDEEIEFFFEDAYTRKIDGVVPSDMDPPWTDLTLQSMEDPTAARRNIETALEKADGDFEEAAEYIKHPPGTPAPHPRTIRRDFYKLHGGSQNALRVLKQIKSDGNPGEKPKTSERRKAHKGEKSHEKEKG